MRITQLAIWLHLVADDEVSIRGPLLSNGLEKTDYQLNQSIAEPHLKIMADLSDAEKTMADLSDTETVARDKKGRDSGRCFRHSPGKLSVSDQRYCPDTNAFSRFFRGNEENDALRDRILAELPFCRISAIVLSELEYGASKSGIPVHRERVARLRLLIPDVAPFDADCAAYTGNVRAYLANLKPNAQPIGHYDSLLAGQALALGACVVTDNTGKFLRVPGLIVENW